MKKLMNCKTLFTTIMLLLGVTSDVFPITAYPQKIQIITESDTLQIKLLGDENNKFALDELGYTILQKEEGWFYAKEDKMGNIITSNYAVVSQKRMNRNTQKFLQSIRKGLVPIYGGKGREQSVNGAITARRASSTGNRKVLVILMQFRDKKFSKSVVDFQRLFNERNYSEDNAEGSVYDYYYWASYGQLNLQSDIIGPFTTQNDMSYYGGNRGAGEKDRNVYALFEEAISSASKVIDLSQYDANQDGYVDNVHIIYAGYGEEAGASSSAIWAHESSGWEITVQNMKIDRYSCAPELRGNRGNGISRIGPHCHEIGHALGAMDYYDTDYSTGGNFLGTGNWDVMASGSWNNDGITPADFNPYVKTYDFGWTKPQSLIVDSINILKSSTDSGQIYKIETTIKDDFFLLENRDGKGFHSAEPGRGLLIFHIGPKIETKSLSNSINTTFPQQCYVVCASSDYRQPSASARTYGDINSDGCPYPGTTRNHSFGDDSTPASLTINGNPAGIYLSDIHLHEDDIVLFYSKEGLSDSTRQKDTSLWEEGFEKLKIPTSWQYSDKKGVGEFSVVTKLSSIGTLQSPDPANGKGYAKFSALSQNGLGRHHTRGILLTSAILLGAERSYRFSMKVRKYARLEDACDSIFINLYDRDGRFIERIISKIVINQDNWEKMEASLPHNVYEFLFGIECNIDYGSIMFIDDLNVVEENKDSGLEQSIYPNCIYVSNTANGISVRSTESVDLLIFNSFGSVLYIDKLSPQMTRAYSLNPGIYILCYGDKQLKFNIEERQ